MSSSTIAVTVVASWSRSGPATSAAAARRSDRGWPRASRLIRSTSSPRRRPGGAAPRHRRAAGCPAGGPGTADPCSSTSPPSGLRGRRGPRATLSCRAGTKVCWSQRSIGRRTSYGRGRGRRVAKAREAGGRILGGREVAASRARDRGEETARRGLDRAAVEAEDDRAPGTCLGRERLEERGLADATDAVDEDDRGALLPRTRRRRARSVSRPTSPVSCASIPLGR